MTFSELLKSKEIIDMDGGFGTQLAARLSVVPKVPETVNITDPDVVIGIHKSYIEAGADIIYTCTFGANSYKTNGSGYSTTEIVQAAVANARKYIELHCCENITREDIAAHVYLSPNHLSTVFNESTSISLREYINICRVHHAQSILDSTNMTICSVALQVDYLVMKESGLLE